MRLPLFFRLWAGVSNGMGMLALASVPGARAFCRAKLLLEPSIRAAAGFPTFQVLAWGSGGAVVAGVGRGKQGHLVDALAPRGDEGRGTLRQALGSREQALIRGSPNGETHSSNGVSHAESIGVRGEPGELKHLSTRRKGHQPRLRQ